MPPLTAPTRHLLLAAIVAAAAGAQAPFELDSLTLAAFRWRQVGPANMMGRVADVEGIPHPSKTFFVAAAAGGIWKTTNNGTTFRPVFDNQRVVSMGDLAIAPSDTMQVWAGTGEPNSRNSISPGGGVYKSMDGGLTWALMGLQRTQAIGRIAIHPTNPAVVYVAALGATWNASRERGLYKTIDGGANWELVKFVSDKAGVVDVALDPSNPDVVWAASWERVRGPFSLSSGGPGSALWKSTDAGRTWVEVKGGGFPESMKGRISIAIARSNAQVMYAMVEADTMPNRSRDRKPAQSRPSGLYRSADGGATWARTSAENTRPFYYSQVRVHPRNPDRVYWSSTPVKVSNDGGRTAMNATVGIHVDHHAMWIDPNDPERMVVGNDGGIGISFDQGGSYDFANVFAIGQFYNVSFDMSVPYRLCGGLQDNGSWCGPSRRRQGSITNDMWSVVGGGDGFVTAQDPTDPNVIYSESQRGSIGRLDFATGERTALARPDWRRVYQAWEDSILAARGDTTVRETPAVRRRTAELRARQRADSIGLDLRWNWNTPFFLSTHNPATVYFGANRVLKSTRRGDGMFAISPDLTFADTVKARISTRTTGGITPDVTGAETYGTIVSLAESPVRAGILFAGTDDGRVWSSRNDGGTWEEHTGRFPGLPVHAYASEIEPSPHDSSTWFVAFDHHRTGDYTPYLYVTTDAGRTFRSIASTLPTGGPDFVHVIRQDPVNRDLLFVGTDVGLFVSVNRGQTWQRFMAGLPTVPVYDLKIHPRDHELIAATHGRSLWVVDIAALQQLTRTIASADAHLFAPRAAFQYGEQPTGGEGMPGGGSPGHKVFRATVPPYGAEIWYRLAVRGSSPVRVEISDVTGEVIRTLSGPSGLGVHRVVWDFRGKAPAAATLSLAQRRDSMAQVRRRDFVFDSLGTAGMDTAALGRFRRVLERGDLGQMAQAFLGAMSGGATPAFGGDRFNPRPGEQAAPTVGGGGGALGGLAAQVGISDPGQAMQMMQILSPPGTDPFSGGGGLGRPQAPVVEPGEYLVSLVVNGATLRHRLRVVRASGTGGSSLPFEARRDQP